MFPFSSMFVTRWHTYTFQRVLLEFFWWYRLILVVQWVGWQHGMSDKVLRPLTDMDILFFWPLMIYTLSDYTVSKLLEVLTGSEYFGNILSDQQTNKNSIQDKTNIIFQISFPSIEETLKQEIRIKSMPSWLNTQCSSHDKAYQALQRQTPNHKTHLTHQSWKFFFITLLSINWTTLMQYRCNKVC